MEVEKVYKYYKYSEVPAEKNVVKFGWRPADILPEGDYILAYHSRSKFATEEEINASRKEGTNAASVVDYLKFFESLTGSNPEAFHKKWDNKEEELEVSWKGNYKQADPKQYMFLLRLARLLVTGKKFVMYSRGFKLVRNEDRNTSAEV